MEETRRTAAPRSGIGSTALARLQLRIPRPEGIEEVVVERRWPDLAAARAWCERSVERAEPGTQVLEVQVFEESWWHAKSWEDQRHRPVPEALQLGILDGTGRISWTEPRAMTARAGVRQPL